MNSYEAIVDKLDELAEDASEEVAQTVCDAKAAIEILLSEVTALQTENAEKDKEIERLRGIVEAYATSARSIALWLDTYCDRSLPYDKMILDAAQKAAVALSRVEAERDQMAGWVDLFCEMLEESFGRGTEETTGARAALAEIGWRGVQGEA